MDLWNEYEGRSIAGLFPLERLIRPEGRSAFFSTSSAGTSTVIRLIESHFDEEEILARWAGVSNLHQPNLLNLTRFGQAMMDETSLVYVVMEPTEADLSQILCERPLTPSEAREVAISLIPALEALHEGGFIHEHIQPANVLAVGEVVKLRSDCIREAPEGTEGTALRTRDVQDLATLLLQCLTQQSSLATGPIVPPLPSPFREIIHNGLSGTWDLARMTAALDASSTDPTAVEHIQVRHPSEPPVRPLPSPVQAAKTQTRLPQGESRQPSASSPQRHSFPQPVGGRVQVPMHPQAKPPQRLMLLAFGILCLIALTVFAFVRGHGSKAKPPTNVPASSSSTDQTMNQPSIAAAPPALKQQTEAIQLKPSAARDEWRIVVFTYNGRAEAGAKAHALEQRFASLHPAVFTPTGRAPYLVTLGGPLTRDAAVTLRNKLRREGLPRDLYAQNYAAKAR